MKGRALRRALEADAIRVNAEVPLIVDTTELVTPEYAKELLKKNKKNRPIQWHRVERYAVLMRAGRWKCHAQGIILDVDGNILSGQHVLLAVTLSGVSVYLRISRGTPADCAEVIDRGAPQSARDLAARQTGRAHSPTEASIARAMLALEGRMQPTADDLADVLEDYATEFQVVLARMRGTKKTREVLMVLAALVHESNGDVAEHLTEVPILADRLRTALLPRTARECWGRGAAFSLAMEQAKRLVSAV